MARIKSSISANLNAALDTIAYSEGTSTSKVTKDDGYDVIVTGIDGTEIFVDYKDHPFYDRVSKVINTKGLTSTAAGRYQQMYKDWPYYKRQLNLLSFAPIYQDMLAIQHIRESRALAFIEAGHFDEFVQAVNNLWASLPGAGYGQRENKLDELRNYYLSKGGKLWESKQSLESSLPQLPVSSAPMQSVNVPVQPKQQPMPQTDKPQSTLSGILNQLMSLIKRK